MLSKTFKMLHQNIPIVHLDLDLPEGQYHYAQTMMEGEIAGIFIEHKAIRTECNEVPKDGYKTIYLFLHGEGTLSLAGADYAVAPETVFLPNKAETLCIRPAPQQALHYLKIVSKLTDQDQKELAGFPSENTQAPYHAKFTDCQAYVEPIKSPNTVSRTILPNKIIPRIAMGTVQTQGPDEVGAHEHPMLEQLFLSLANNNCTVYADEAKVDLPPYALLHIPLGSRHSVSVEEGKELYYVWMDFFLDSKGEEWLKTHIIEEED